MGDIFDRAPTFSSDEFSVPQDEQPTPEQIEKGRQVSEYYDSLPQDAEPSPVEPLFKDMFTEKDNDKE